MGKFIKNAIHYFDEVLKSVLLVQNYCVGLIKFQFIHHITFCIRQNFLIKKYAHLQFMFFEWIIIHSNHFYQILDHQFSQESAILYTNV